MTKKAFLLGVGLTAMSVGPTLAADLAARPYTKAPPPVAAMYSWSGFYIGGNAGGGWSHNCWTANTLGGIGAVGTAEGCHDASGGLVGGQIGYRWQMANVVFGLEAQGDWADIKGSNSSLLGFAGGVPYTNQTKIDAIGLFTGQIGYAWNNVLWYAKGGAAVTHDKYSGITIGAVPGIPAVTTFDQASETRWGGAIGTGIEVGFAPGWSVGVEYDHLFMGDRNINFTSTAVAGGGFSRNDNVKQDVDMATVRVNYTFGGAAFGRY